MSGTARPMSAPLPITEEGGRHPQPGYLIVRHGYPVQHILLYPERYTEIVRQRGGQTVRIAGLTHQMGRCRQTSVIRQRAVSALPQILPAEAGDIKGKAVMLRFIQTAPQRTGRCAMLGKTASASGDEKDQKNGLASGLFGFQSGCAPVRCSAAAVDRSAPPQPEAVQTDVQAPFLPAHTGDFSWRKGQRGRLSEAKFFHPWLPVLPAGTVHNCTSTRRIRFRKP